MSVELKIKSKHLGVEAQIIRREETKLKRQIEWAKTNSQDWEELLSKWHSLNSHRRSDVRNENRATFLARAYIEGKAYKTIEPKTKPEREYEFYTRILPRVLAMVKKYDNANLDIKHIKAWVEAK